LTTINLIEGTVGISSDLFKFAFRPYCMPVTIAVPEKEFNGKSTIKLVATSLSKSVVKKGDELIFIPVSSKTIEFLHTLRDNDIKFREHESLP
jgi:hypothetical protein